MYKLLVVLVDGKKIVKELSRTSMEQVMRIGVQTKGIMSYAKVTSPSGTTHDVTNRLETYK